VDRVSDPYSWQVEDTSRLIAGLRLEFAVNRPNAHAVITGITSDAITVAPWPPLWTRHMLGVQEAERDRRRRRRVPRWR
jgi:hypothetical protein